MIGAIENLQQREQYITEKIKYLKMEQLNALSFNNDDSIIACNSIHMLLFYKFQEGTITIQQKIIKAHPAYITVITFYKQSNSCLTACVLGIIKQWRLNKFHLWEQEFVLNDNDFKIMAIIINKQEDQFITCSNKGFIKVWNLTKTWIPSTLFQFQVQVSCISFNDSETQFASCDINAKIVIWEINNKKWQIKQQICNQVNGYRICYIDDHQFALQPNHLGRLLIYNNLNKQKIFKEIQSIKLKKGQRDFEFFPSIYCKNKKILINKHNSFIYFIKQNEPGKFDIIQTIEVNQIGNVVGAISNDSEWFVHWDEKQKIITSKKYQIIRK